MKASVTDVRSRRGRRSLALVCWLMFAAGLLLQLVGPRLKIANRAFVIPQKLTTAGNNIRLVELIGRQRRMQVTSALLTLSGAIGLAVLYRDTLTGKASRQRANQSPGKPDAIPREVNVQRDPEEPI
jgi:hypothetical protein